MAVVVGKDTRFGVRNSGDVDTLRELGETHGFEVLALDDIGEGDTTAALELDAAARRAARGLGGARRRDPRAAAPGQPAPSCTATTAVASSATRRRTSPRTTRVSCPRDGVYAGWLVRLDLAADDPDRTLPAAISVGTNPTFDGHQRRVEAYVLDRTDLDLYGERVVVEFVDRLRPTLRFDVGRRAGRADGAGRGPVSRDPLGHRAVLTSAAPRRASVAPSWLRARPRALHRRGRALAHRGRARVVGDPRDPWRRAGAQAAARRRHRHGVRPGRHPPRRAHRAGARTRRLRARRHRARGRPLAARVDGQRVAVLDPAARRLHPAALGADEGRARHRPRHAPRGAGRPGAAAAPPRHRARLGRGRHPDRARARPARPRLGARARRDGGRHHRGGRGAVAVDRRRRRRRRRA